MSAIEDRISTLEQYLESTKSTVGELAEELENVRQTRTERRSELEKLRQELRERTDQRARRVWLEEQGYDHTTFAEEPVALGVKNLPSGFVQVDMVENSEVLGSVTLSPSQVSSLFFAEDQTKSTLESKVEEEIAWLEAYMDENTADNQVPEDPEVIQIIGRHLYALKYEQYEMKKRAEQSGQSSVLMSWLAERERLAGKKLI